jgi:hypothetical protein
MDMLYTILVFSIQTKLSNKVVLCVNFNSCPDTQSSKKCYDFSPVVRIGTPPPSYPLASVHTPLVRRGRPTSLRVRGQGGSNSNEGSDTVVFRTLCFVLCDSNMQFF